MAVKGASRKGQKAMKAKKTVQKGTLRHALVSGMKAATGRKDIEFQEASAVAASTQRSIPIEERAGYPVKRAKGSVDPKQWKTHHGVPIAVDFSRAAWLPDDWGQGVKPTQPTAHSTGKHGGVLTCYVAPDGKSFFHKETSEQYAGYPLTSATGFNGQVRLATLQAQQAVQLARAAIKELHTKGSSDLIGTDPDHEFFALLSPQERKSLPSKDAFHFCVVSARRATKLQGIQDIMMVETQLKEAGATATWYVDEASVKDYKALGLKVMVGGKLTEARNRCLKDARRMNKVCVQISDDISAWEYREGKQAAERTDDAMNAAHHKARRYIISPVAAARFICAKMRAAEDPKPKLGGCYMLGACARTFAGPAFVRHNFILGDFFVVDVGSKVNFDENMKLKEDYDFTCAHIKAHGSIMRCQRMTLNVKHYANQGGACSNRDSKGQEEKRNIDILNEKWPGVFRPNPKRRNEVIMKWKTANVADGDEEVDPSEAKKTSSKSSSSSKIKGVRKTIAKKPTADASALGLPPKAVLLATSKEPKAPNIVARRKEANGRTVESALGSMRTMDANGEERPYLISDLKYDLKAGYLRLVRIQGVQ